MKVYELMKALADCPAGAEVVFRRLAELKEMPIYDGQPRLAEFVIRTTEIEDADGFGRVLLDGWAE